MNILPLTVGRLLLAPIKHVPRMMNMCLRMELEGPVASLPTARRVGPILIGIVIDVML